MKQYRTHDCLLSAEEDAFRSWVETVLRPRALAQMIRVEVFDNEMGNAAFLPEVLSQQQHQSEFQLPIWEYLDVAVSEDRIRRGRKALRTHRNTFLAIERRYGIDPGIICAIWGMESGFGAVKGPYPVLSALATLAWRGRQQAYFESELVAALRIIQSGLAPAHKMIGSWSGAMGQGRFMPSSFLNFSVDFDEDGERNIWGPDPTDALASIGLFLYKHIWKPGQPWGHEIALPEDFDYALINADMTMSTTDWHQLGIKSADGSDLPNYGKAGILLPAGADGPAFIVHSNYHVLLRYNRASSYALAVGHLADRLTGGKPFVRDWPRTQDALTPDQISEAQVRLTAIGYATYGVDGMIGPRTTDAVRRFQHDRNMVADGYLTLALLEALRSAHGAT